MRDIKDIISDPKEMEKMALENRETIEAEELRKGVVLINKVIRGKAAKGFGFVTRYDDEVAEIFKDFHFVSWETIAKHFRDAGFILIGEESNICWVTKK